MISRVLKIDILEEIRNNIAPGENFPTEEMDEIVTTTKEYISGDETFWNAFNSCIIDAINYVRRRRNK